MLPLRKHWHNAPEQAPYREARLLRFAGAPNTPQTPDPLDPLNSAQTFAAPNLAPNGQPVQNVAANTSNVRAQVAQTLANAETETETEVAEEAPERLSAEKVSEHAKAVLAKMQAYFKDLRTLRPAMEGTFMQNSTLRAQWDADELFVSRELNTIENIVKEAEFAAEWQAGQKTPVEFKQWVRSHHEQNPDGTKRKKVRIPEEDDVLANLSATIRATSGNVSDDPASETLPDISTPDKWETTSTGGKLYAIEHLSEVAGMQEKLAHFEEMLQAYEAAFAKSTLPNSINKVKEEKAKQTDATQDGDIKKAEMGFFESMGIEFYTVHEMIGAGKKWWEAYKAERDGVSRIKTARLAKRIGRTLSWLPYYGEGAQRTLDQQVDSENNKEKSEHKDYLKDRGYSFAAIFDDGRELDKSMSEPNKAMAVLEYAAGRGWLYKLADQEAADIGAKKIFNYNFRSLLPPDWSDEQAKDYFRSLNTQNQRGAEEEKEKVKGREKSHDTAPPYIKALERELDNRNFWGALGVVEAAMDRAKAGYMSGWLAATIIRKLRDNDDIRRYIPGAVIENFGFHTFNKTPFTLSNLTMDRGTIVEWLKAGDKNIANAGTLGKVTSLIEGAIARKAGSNLSKLTNQEVTELIGRVLASETVEVPGGGKVSIFDAEFEDYRNNNPLFNYYDDVNIAKEQSDYYTSPSESLLVPVDIVRNIFGVNSTGDLLNHRKAMLFTGHVINRYEELLAADKAAANTFRTEMGEKLSAGIKVLFTANGFQKAPDYKYMTSVKRNGKDIVIDQEPFIAKLLKYGFINSKLMEDAQAKGGKEFRKIVEDQASKMAAPINAPEPDTDTDAPGAAPRRSRKAA